MPRAKSKTNSIDVNVTPEIIESATRRNSGHCVVADALKAAIPEATMVSVDLQTIRFSLPTTGRRYIFLTPQAAQHVLLDFDQGNEITPQRIKLGRPAQSVPTKAANRTRQKSQRHPKHVRLPKGDPDAKHVEMINNGHGQTQPIIMGGQTPPIGALADPPKRRVDPIENRRYAGQRRAFGLRILRP